MTPKGNWLELVIISALFFALSVWGLVWDFASGLLFGGIDGIMVAAVCLLMALIFAGMLLLHLQEGGILPSFSRKHKTAAAPSTSAKSAAAPAVKAASPQPPQPQSPRPQTTAPVK